MKQLVKRYGILIAAIFIGCAAIGFGLYSFHTSKKMGDRLIVAQARTLVRSMRKHPVDAKEFFESNKDLIRGLSEIKGHKTVQTFGEVTNAPPPPMGVAHRLKGFARVTLRPPLKLQNKIPGFVIEFTPTWANQLERKAKWDIFFNSLLGLSIISAGVFFVRLYSRTEKAEKRATKASHLAHIGEMSTVLAHEIRNPLASLKGHAQLLEEKLDGAHVTKAQTIVSEAERIQNLVTQLLSFARSPTGTRYSATPVKIAQKILSNFSHLNIKSDFSKSPSSFELEKEALESILSNLLANAETWAKDSQIDVSLSGNKDEITLTVRDRGPGIAPQDLDNVFKPFFTKKTKNGAGLGLAIIQRIADRHDGRAVVENTKDGGALFTVKLRSNS